MDSMDNFRTRLEALVQQTKAIEAHTQTVERRLQIGSGGVMNKLAMLLALLLAGGLVLTTSFASATTFVVTNVNDSGAGSLRQAILDANSTPGADTIVFDNALIGQTIVLTSGALSIAGDLAIIGLGADALTVNGNGADVFRIDTSGNTVVFTDITVTNGEDGIQISVGANNNIVTVIHCRIAGQVSDDGLSIDGDRNTVTVKNTLFSGNEDNLAVEGNNNIVTMTDSASTLAREDGIEVDGNDNVVTVKNTTLNNNGVGVVPNDGLDVDGARNVLQMEQVTFSGNGEDGLDIEGPNNRVTVNHSTITGNGRDGIINQDVTSTSTIVVYNSIVAGNIGPDADGNFQSAGYNLVGNGAASTGFDGPGDQVGTRGLPINPGLGPLQDNCGQTSTHALQTGSPAINAGDPNFVPPPEFDQRGRGIPRVQAGRIDIGAYEANVIVIPLPVGPDILLVLPFPSPPICP